jgi:serine/threonine protein kinase/tetratricopeptide (TPR) repeat protein
MKELEPPTTLSHYRIVSKLGVGGMGEVYLAEDTKLDRKVALKILPFEVASKRHRMQRFVQEAKAASALNHPNIITIYEIDESDSRNFIALEFIDGQTLRQILRRTEMHTDQILDVAIQTAKALSAAHEAGIIHRDIKPENIMLRRDGIVKVLDFGLAKLTEPAQASEVDMEAPTSAAITEAGEVLGTTSYMSPEQARGLQLDSRSDVYSLGVLIYEMVARRIPYVGISKTEILASILNDKAVPPLARYAREVPDELERIVQKSLAKERDQRYQSAKDLLIDLRHLKKRLEVEAELQRTAPERLAGSPSEAVNTAARTAPTAVGSTQTSSAEYLVNQVKLHKRGALTLLAVFVIAVLAAGAFWYFKSTRIAPLTEKDTIVLAEFANATGDSVFDGTLKQGLAVQLEQSPFLNIFSDQRIRETLRFMNRSPDERVTKEIAREICQRQGFKAFLAGSISNLGNNYVITIEATNVQTGDTITREQVEAQSKEQVLSALGTAATKLRERLGESLSSIQKYDVPIHQATTSSLEALKAYSVGVEYQLKGKYLEAIPFFRQATEKDPNFARAYAAMSSMYYNTRQYDLAAETSRKAYDLRDRVGEYERLYITQIYYDNVTGELDKYLDTLELWKRTYPRDSAPHNNLAVKYNELGQFDKAAEEAREAVRLNPNSASGHSLLASSAVGLNHFDEAKQIIRQALSQKLENLRMHQNLYRIAFAQADAAGVNNEIAWATGKPEQYAAQSWQGESAAFSGQLRKAKEFSSTSIEMAERRELKEVAAQLVAGAAARNAQLQDCGSVKDQTAKALQLSHDRITLSLSAQALAVCGDTAQTKTLVDELSRRFPTDSLINQVRIPLIEAHAEMQRGNAAKAIELLEKTRLYGRSILFPIAYLRGQAYLAEKKGGDAAAQFQEILDNRGWSPISYFYPLAYVGLARAAALQGDTAKARKAYEDFFAIWKDGDTDVPILIEAKKEYEKLKPVS